MSISQEGQSWLGTWGGMSLDSRLTLILAAFIIIQSWLQYDENKDEAADAARYLDLVAKQNELMAEANKDRKQANLDRQALRAELAKSEPLKLELMRELIEKVDQNQ